MRKKRRGLGAHLDLNGIRFFLCFPCTPELSRHVLFAVHFSSNFDPLWALHGMGSYAFSPRRRSPNTFFRFGIVVENSFQKTVFWFRFGLTRASGSTKNTRKIHCRKQVLWGLYKMLDRGLRPFAKDHEMWGHAGPKKLCWKENWRQGDKKRDI